jgi:hypothetical protein
MKFKYEPKKLAKAAVAFGLVALALVIEAVSFAANYSILFRSFADWPPEAQRVLAVGAAIVIEGAVIILILGLLYSFESSIEIGIAGVTLAALVFVMACNFVTHGNLSEGQALNGFQGHWVSWVGKLALFIVFAAVIALVVFNPDAIARRKEREVEGKKKDARNQAYEQVFGSDEFKQAMQARMEQLAKQVANDVLPEALPPVPPVGKPKGETGPNGLSQWEH